MSDGNYVNLQSEECNTTSEQLHQLHSEIREKVTELSRQIKQLTDLDGGFFVDKISAKIQDLLESLEQDVMTELEETWLDSEQGIDSCIARVMETDTAG